jgi:class 3 adenylate cyclase/alpha-beta hydrolase superfamily lysophospholipase
VPVDIQYARSGDVSIAYTVIGDQALDLVYVHGFVGHLEIEFERPEVTAMCDRLAAYARVITFDRRGTGLSDRVRDVPTLEARMDDVRAVLDAVGSERAVIFGTFEAASMACLFAATYPERVVALVLYNAVVRGTWSPDYPWASTSEEWQRRLADMGARWGTAEYVDETVRTIAPSRVDDDDFRIWQARHHRAGASPGAAVAIARMTMIVDIREILAAIHVPTLVLSSPEFVDPGLYVAARIPGARHEEVPGEVMMMLHGEELHGPVESFVRSAVGESGPDTVLSTVLFTDIVGSTAKAVELGDARWAELVGRHHALVRRQLDRYRGVELDTAGDGFFATFDGPIRAIRCARAIVDSVRDLGLEVRAGIHTGECERIGPKLGGLAVSIGARVAAQATPGEVLVSSTVKDLVAGSGITFEERGAHELKGVPGEWHLYAVADVDTQP